MKYTALRDVCEINMGQSPDSSSYNEEGRGIPFFQGNADFGERNPVTRVWCDAPSKIANANDILISVRAPIGAVNYAAETCCIGRGLAAITPDLNRVSSEYIFWLLIGKNAELNSKGTGSTFKAINRRALEEIQVPDVSLKEQAAYAANLETAYKIIQMRKQQLSTLDDLIKARFVEMFGDPEINTMGWPIRTLDTLLSVEPQNGLYKPQSDYVIDGSGIPILRIDAFYDGKVTSFLGLKRLQCSEAERNRYLLKENDIVINRVNSIEYLGKCAWITEMTEPTVFESNMMRFHADETEIDPCYLTRFLCSSFIYKQILNRAKKAVNQASINQRDVQSFRIMVPPLILQKQFAAFVAQIDKSKFIVIKRSDKVINEQLQQEFRDLDHLIELAVNQSPFTEYSDKEFIFAAIISFVDEIRKSIAAINAYGIIECKLVPVPPEQVELWELNIESVWRRLISDLSKLFDRAETCGKSNCSLQQLKEFCLRPENRALFPEQETDPLITAIGSLYQQYEDVISRSTRNEQVAHHDLKALRSTPPGFISLKALNELVEDTTKVVSEIGSKLFPFDVSFPSIEDYQHYYKAAIMSMLGHKEIT